MSLTIRLRSHNGFFLNGAHWMMGAFKDQDCQEAADRIELLETQNSELQGLVVTHEICSEQLEKRIDALEAQNAELFEMVKRAALIIPQHQENWHCDFYTMTHEATI